VTPKRPRRKAVELDPAQHRANRAYGRQWQRVSDQALRQAGYRCEIQYPGVCNGRADVADHIVAVDEGGLSVLSNAQAACRPCNAAKGYLRRMERAGSGSSTDVRQSKFPPRNGTSCPHRHPDGSWCPGEPGHWSRWWVGGPDDPPDDWTQLGAEDGPPDRVSDEYRWRSSRDRDADVLAAAQRPKERGECAEVDNPGSS
jgi:HNH endonuclease